LRTLAEAAKAHEPERRLRNAQFGVPCHKFLGSKATVQSVILELDQTKRNYMHAIVASEAAKVGADLFMKSKV